MCGGTSSPISPSAGPKGLSPRVRGNRIAQVCRAGGEGSIPACAGEPQDFREFPRGNAVYPRVCGGTRNPVQAGFGGGGLSPRVRGNRWERLPRRLICGSIPACAGEPLGKHTCLRHARVYPRVCGGTLLADPGADHTPGLSPRVRGNPAPDSGVGGCPGLSPRVRGNPPAPLPLPGYQRSIPACAGEPRIATGKPTAGRVYPRVCGGTSGAGHILPLLQGLSPRVRGNPAAVPYGLLLCRSIPACAGEPLRSRSCRSVFEVYPRVCGGTPLTSPRRLRPHGLSPRVRGNRRAARAAIFGNRSIPACAGEPHPFLRIQLPPRVYPRVCGGTARLVCRLFQRMGLSPRVRGNQPSAGLITDDKRSIPACAGEPVTAPKSVKSAGVYPRVCGGTNDGYRYRNQNRGLSPRVRGNLPAAARCLPPPRSIPACAGEPRVCRAG